MYELSTYIVGTHFPPYLPNMRPLSHKIGYQDGTKY